MCQFLSSTLWGTKEARFLLRRRYWQKRGCRCCGAPSAPPEQADPASPQVVVERQEEVKVEPRALDSDDGVGDQRAPGSSGTVWRGVPALGNVSSRLPSLKVPHPQFVSSPLHMKAMIVALEEVEHCRSGGTSVMLEMQSAEGRRLPSFEETEEYPSET
jgi:hypothetical protein